MTSIIVKKGATYLQNSPICTFKNNTSVSYLAPNAFQSRVYLPYPLMGCFRMFLKNIQLPLAINNIRSTSNLNTFSIYTGKDASGNLLNNLTIILPDGYYSTITSLITEINSLFASNYPSYNIVLSQNTTNSNYLQINSTSFSSIYVLDTNLTKMLGFSSSLNTMSTNVTHANVIYRLSIDDYLNIYIGNTSTNCINTTKGLCTFKVPLNSNNGVVYYLENSTSIFANCDFSTISHLDIYVFDKMNYSLNSMGVDFSLTIQIDSLL